MHESLTMHCDQSVSSYLLCLLHCLFKELCSFHSHIWVNRNGLIIRHLDLMCCKSGKMGARPSPHSPSALDLQFILNVHVRNPRDPTIKLISMGSEL